MRFDTFTVSLFVAFATTFVPSLAMPSKPLVRDNEDTETGPLYGSTGAASCHDMADNSGADWLLASTCALIKCNPAWEAKNLVIASGTAEQAALVNVTTWDNNLDKHVTSVPYGFGIQKGYDFVKGAWFMGAIEHAIISMLGDAAFTSGLLTSPDVEFNDNGGYYGLTYLTGQKVITETIPTDLDSFYNDMLSHANSSPIVVRMNGKCSGINDGRHYVVYNIDSSDKEITLWDVKKIGTTMLSAKTLQGCSEALFHLDGYAAFTG